jgi:hypothetical protein
MMSHSVWKHEQVVAGDSIGSSSTGAISATSASVFFCWSMRYEYIILHYGSSPYLY